MLLDAAGIYQAWSLRQPIIDNAKATLDLMDHTLTTTAAGLSIIKISLQSVTTTIATVQSTVNTTSQTVTNAGGAVNSLSTIVGENLGGTITSALATLDSLKSTTQVVDDFLSAIAGTPFLGLSYNPATSLSGSISQLSSNLSQVPPSLNSLQTNLKTSGQSLTEVAAEAKALAVQLGQVQADLARLTGVIDQYEEQVSAFRETVKASRANVESIVTGGVAGLTFILFWIGITQLTVLVKGLEWMGVRVHVPGQLRPVE